MRSLTFFSVFVALVTAQYELQTTFAGGPTFLDNFGFWTSWDPTLGFVHYVDRATAESLHMINTTDTSVSFGVEHEEILNPNANLGRKSLRLTSFESWTHGLFIIDMAHMPSTTCGSWPALWTLGGGTWPFTGEIDIIEWTNIVPNNLMALHTGPDCSIAGANDTGTLLTSDCGRGNGFTGCTVSGNTPNNAGSAFNSVGGGVYAMEWTSEAIRVWSFPRDAIPESISSDAPDVNAFGEPAARFQGSCDIDSNLYDHKLVFNIDFCGTWAGPVFHMNGCPQLDPDNSWASCNEYVALNPHAYYETRWEVNYVKVYQAAPGNEPAIPAPQSSVIPAVSTSSVTTALSNAQGRSSTPTMSIAPTVPSISTGSFTATSSVLSVLSSLSAQSTSLVGRATTPSSVSSASVETAPPASTSTSPLPVSSSVPPSISTSPVVPAATPTISSVSIEPSTFTSADVSPTPLPTSPITSTTSPCTGYVCTSYSSVIVWQTVTVTGSPRQEVIAIIGQDAHIERRQNSDVHVDTFTTSTATPGAEPTSTSPHLDATPQQTSQFPACDFTITSHAESKTQTTDFACTTAAAQIFNGTLVTRTTTFSTSIFPNQPLVLEDVVKIEEIGVKTEGTADFSHINNYTYTGSFTPSAAFVASSTLTAYPMRTSCSSTSPTMSLAGPITPFPITQIANDDSPLRPAARVMMVDDGSTLLTIQCTNIMGPESQWTTSYNNAAWWILACALAEFPTSYVLPPWKRDEPTFTPTKFFSYDPISTLAVTTNTEMIIAPGAPSSQTGAKETRVGDSIEHSHSHPTSPTTTAAHSTSKIDEASSKAEEQASKTTTQASEASSSFASVLLGVGLVFLGIVLALL